MNELEHDARIINSTLRRYGVAAGVQTNREVAFQSSGMNVYAVLRHPQTKVTDVLRLAEEIDEALTAARGEDTRCRFDVRPLRIMVPRRNPQTIDVMDVLSKLAPKVRGKGDLLMLAGEAIKVRRAVPLIIDLASPTSPHVLVAGTTGSGKTTLLLNLIISLGTLNRQRNVSIRVLDPKGVDLHILNGLPALEYAVIRDAETCVDALRATVADMDERKRRGVANPEHKIVVVIDELADLIAVAGDDVVESLNRLLQAGRGLGIHVISATQKPLSGVIGSLAKANFPLRLVGRVASKSDATTAAGIGDTGAERLPGLGAFVKVGASGTEIVQAYAADIQRIVNWLSRYDTPVRYTVQSKNSQKQAISGDFDVPQPVPAPVPQPVPDKPQTDAIPYRMPTPQDARVIRAWYQTLGSKNAVIRQAWPNRNKNTCLKYLDAALNGAEVTA